MSKQVAEACTNSREQEEVKEEVKEANAQLKRVIESQRIIDKLIEFDAVHEKHPMFKMTRQ